VRRTFTTAGTALLLAGPTVLAFFSGGYFDEPRLVAAAMAWTAVFGLAIWGPSPLPRSRSGWATVGGLAGIAAWTAVSLLWAPLGAPAGDNLQRLLLYVGVLLVAIALLRDARARRWVEPALALGALVVTCYGLSGRLLPGIVELTSSLKAQGRLEQPISYWNAEGLLAAMGFVLCMRLAGDRTRPAAVRVLSAAAAAPLGAGVYLTYSRSAIAAGMVGAIVLLAIAPSLTQLRAILSGFVSAVLAATACAAFAGVASLDGTHSDLVREGAIVLSLLIAIAGAAALAAAWMVVAERRGTLRLGTIERVRRLPAIAGVAATLVVVGLVVADLEESGRADRIPGQPSRISTVTSHRNEFWRVGIDAFADHPFGGVGSGGFRVVWREQRRVSMAALEVHSLVLEMATELGIPGLLMLGLFLGGVAGAARTAIRRFGPAVAGASAVAVVWLLAASVDWHWQLPAVSMPFLILVGLLVAESERPSEPLAVESKRDEPARERERLLTAS
jgi:hypothetical protein